MKRARASLVAALLASQGWILAADGGNPQPADQPPKIIKQVSPKFPDALADGVTRGRVLLDFVIDSAGKVQQVTVVSSSNAAFEQPAVAAVRQWQFLPGEKNGQAVATHMKLPIIFAPRWPSLDQVPEAIRQSKPEYPDSLLQSYNSGEVILDFLVDKAGEVRDVKVISSSHHDFEAPAVAALLKWKFIPGKKNGAAVVAHMQVPIIFQINGGPSSLPWVFPERGSKKLPPEFQYDTPPKPRLTFAPVFPYDLLQRRVNGEATVGFVIDPFGHTRSVTVEKASNPAFGAAARAMMAAWQFEPARKQGQPCWAMLGKVQRFNLDDRDTAISDSARRLLNLLRKNPAAVVANMTQLDSPLHPLYRPGPVVPETLDVARLPATASIKFVVDRDGHAQLPQVLAASRDDFGWAAAMAVAQWQFSIPTKGRKAVDVYAIAPFKYFPAPAIQTLPKS